MSLKFNTYRAKRYLRSRFVEGKYLLASEASDLQLESLQVLRKAIEKSLGSAVAIDDAWKVELINSTQILIKPGQAWVKGLPVEMRSGGDQLVSGAVLTIGIVPVGVSVSDEPNGDGKILTFNDGATTPTNLYRLIVSAQEELITDVEDPFLKNLNLTESTAQKVRLVYRLNLVPVSLQSTSPVPYRDENSTSLSATNFPNSGGFAAPNLSNEVIITPTPAGNGELISTSLITGSEGIDGRDVELVIRNDGGLGGIVLPNSPVGQQAFANSTLIDSNGNVYHVNAIFNDTVSTQLVLRIDKEVDQANPQIINGSPFKLIKREVFVTDDINGSPQGRLYWDVAEIDWNETSELVHPSKISDLRKSISSQEELQDQVFRKDNLVVTGGGSIVFDPAASLLTWDDTFKIIDAFGVGSEISAGDALLPDLAALVYELDLVNGGAVERGTLSVNVTGTGVTLTVDPVTLSQVRVGNIIVNGNNEFDQIIAIDEVNLTIETLSGNISIPGAATIYLDVFAEGTAPLSKNSFVLAVRNGNEISINIDKETETESENLNLKMIRGGNWSWDLVNETLAWSADAYIQIPGLTEARNTIPAGAINLLADEVAYVEVLRTPGGATNLTVNVVANIDSLLPSANRLVIARRINESVLLGTDSMRLEHGDSRQLQVTYEVVDVKAIDVTSSVLPAPLANIDGVGTTAADKVLFTKLTTDPGIYAATNSGWTLLSLFKGSSVPTEGSLVAVQDSTTNLRGLWQYVSTEGWKKLDKTLLQNEPSGFKTTTEATLSFNNITRQLTITPVGSEFDYYINGRLFRKTGPVTFPAIPNTSGLYHFYFDGETPTVTITFDPEIILSKAYVANVYWSVTDAAGIMMGEERHGLTMDGVTHRYLHNTVGTRLGNGLAAGNLTTSGTGAADADAQLSIANGSIFDEDLRHAISHNAAPSSPFQQILDPIAEIPIYYRDGSNEWRKLSATQFPAHKVTNRLGYNQDSGGWVITEAPNDGDFVAMWLFATNNMSEPIIAILGQRVDSTLDDARTNNTYESLSFGDLPSAEMKVLYRLIFETDSAYTNTVSAALRDVRDLRQAIDTALPAFSVSDHGALSGLLDQDHPASAIYTQPAAFDGTLSVADDDVQKALTTIDKYFAALQLREHPSNKKRVIVTGADKVKTDGTTLAQQIQSLMVNFNGAEIDFNTGIIYQSDGITPLGLNFTPATIAVGQWRWYSVQAIASTVGLDNRISLQMLVLPSNADGASQSAAPRAPFGTGIKIGQVAVEMGAVVINDIFQAQMVQLGVGSGGAGEGTGDANAVLESLKNQLIDSYFELVTPNIFSSDEDDKVDGTSTGEYSLVDRTFNFAANAVETMLSTDMLDPEEFLANADALEEIELSVYWELANIDVSAVYEVSRNGGLAWQTVTMERVGTTDMYRGYHKFSDELTNQTLYSPVVSGDLNASNQLSQSFVIPAGEKKLIKSTTLTLTKTGSPAGNIFVSICADNAGSPGTVLSESSAIVANSLVTGSNTINVPDIYLAVGTYHIKVRTDAAYKASYVNGVTELNLSGSTVVGIDLDLRVRISSSNTAGVKKLVGYGIFYDKAIAANVASGSINVEVFEFDGDDDIYEFTLTKFVPHADLLKVYDVNTGQVYDYGAFGFDGQKVVFQPGQFLQPGETVKLRFIQVEGSAFDSSDVNGLLLASNHLGSTDASIDRSLPGRGIILKRPDGTLREISIDDSDNIVISSLP